MRGVLVLIITIIVHIRSTMQTVPPIINKAAQKAIVTVSYTHLDVYKRQARFTIRAAGL